MSQCLKTACIQCWMCPFQLLLLLVCNSFFYNVRSLLVGQKPHPKTLPLIQSAFSALNLTLEDMWDIFRKQGWAKKVQSTLPKSRLLSSKVTADRTRTWTGLTGSPKLLVYSSIYQTRMSLQKGVPSCTPLAKEHCNPLSSRLDNK